MNFMGIREQRFSTQLERSKNRLQTPKKTLHAFNLPKGLTEDVLLKMLEDKGCATPQKVKFVENKYKGEYKGFQFCAPRKIVHIKHKCLNVDADL